MKQHTTNYFNTFIEVAHDCPAFKGEVPPFKGDNQTAANIQFDIISKNPYKFTSDDVLFQVYSRRNDLISAEFEEARKGFFSKGQACFRSSPLTKRYGWGIHCNSEAKIAIYGMETQEYERLCHDQNLMKVKAMRTKKNK